jgi:hypothetical protein
MKAADITKDLLILKNIGMQTTYSMRVILPQMDKSIHLITTEQDLLVNKFKDKFEQSIVSTLNEHKATYSLFDKDLKFLEDKFEKSLSIVNNIGDLSDYEATLVDVRHQLGSLISQLDSKIEKYSKRD